jgi:hypothetical protein
VNETFTDTLFLTLYSAISDETLNARIAYKEANIGLLKVSHESIESLTSLTRFAINAPSQRIDTIARNLYTGKTNWTQAIDQLTQYKVESETNAQ